MFGLHKTALNFSNEEYKLYSRQLIIDKIGIIGQHKLKQTKILIIGAGGLGCPIILYLATSGIKYIGIIDNDNIDASNLNRQTLYDYTDINKSKTLCIQKQINNKNPLTKIILHKYKLTANNAIEVLKYYDIVIDACDNFETRYVISSSCHLLHKIHIYGGVHKFEGQVLTLNYKNNTNYFNLYPKSLKLKNKNCNTQGILGITTGIIGIMQATETIKIILGIGTITSSHLSIYNILDNSLNKIQIYDKPFQYNTLKKNQEIKNVQIITSIQMQYIKNKTNELPILIDIREQIEFDVQHISKSMNCPLSTLHITNNLNFLQQVNINNTIIIYCSSSYRAFTASNILFKNNIKHYILK